MPHIPKINLERVLYNMPGLCFWKDIHFQYLGASKEMLNSIGLKSVNDIIGKKDQDMPWYNDADLYQEQDKLALKGQIQFKVNTFLRTDGARVVHLVKKGPLMDDNKKPIGIIGVGFCLTKHNYADLFSLLAFMGFSLSDFILTIEKKKI